VGASYPNLEGHSNELRPGNIWQRDCNLTASPGDDSQKTSGWAGVDSGDFLIFKKKNVAMSMTKNKLWLLCSPAEWGEAAAD